MKRKPLILVAVLAVAAFGLLLLLSTINPGAKPPDRVVQGKLISLWVKQTLTTDQYYLTVPALKEAGEEAVPFLIPALETRDSALNTAWVRLWPKLPQFIKQRLNTPILAKDRRMRAVVALREMGSAERTAVPALIARLCDKDGTIRLHSAITLGNIGPGAQGAVSALEPFLKSKSHTVRVYTANALWKITLQPEPSLSVLEEGMKDHRASFRWAAAVFLGEMGPAAKRTIPLLEQATSDTDKEVASLAIQALAEISPETVPILTNLLLDPDPAIRISAATALGKLGLQAREAVPLLVKALSDHARGAPVIMGRPTGSEEVRSSASTALKTIDPAAAAKAGVQ
jgi:HEAT repeat protein